MKHVLSDLYGHQAWANAEHWRAIQAHAPAAADRAIHDRLHHIMQVQQAFLWIVQGSSAAPTWTKPTDYADVASMAPVARRADSDALALVGSISEERLETIVPVPWFKDPPLSLQVSQALLQAAMHSHYHRGQNATRLRELGGEPPLTDLIVWYWKGRPAAEWGSQGQ
jgi:uncharacterized damage-inducible protein DinB